MKIEITDSNGMTHQSRVCFPTDDGTALGEPLVQIETVDGYIQLSKGELFKLYRKYLKELCNHQEYLK